ncbi:hypothetical protein [Lederbergia lenta]|uniref:hypothetical protein n=1 Tax=Lederbergia lenta TaxID=1467 RepID=UPI00203D4A1F|nr:hypothetical protein [Lederbergia lenta]MCM3109903.1 hypothetical protein [Lederbergia lenta]
MTVLESKVFPIDIYSLKNYIIDNPELIGLVLEKSGFHQVDDDFNQGLEYRCAREEGKNPTAVRVFKDTLYATCFSTNLKGDLITLVQDKLKTSFPKAVKFIANIVNFKDLDAVEYTLPFGGFYKNIMRLSTVEPIDMETYSEKILDEFKNIPNKMFLEDGISADVQSKYKIGYDFLTNRITVPWRDANGEICGLMGRLNKREVDEYESKWYPIIAFPKSKTLFGYSSNYNTIQEHGICIVSESEKGTMALSSKGMDVGLSLGGSNLSEAQSNHIKSLFPKRIIIALDEGLEEEISRDMAIQLKMNSYYNNHVGYIFDKHNDIMPKGSKLAPADLNNNVLKKLINQHVVWI